MFLRHKAELYAEEEQARLSVSTPQEYNVWASQNIWQQQQLPRTWVGKRFQPSSTDFANAVKAFQIQANLKADSKLGPTSWNRMQQTLGRETRGLDVSKYQGNIDWPKVVLAGYEFCIIKATEGQDYTDTKFIQNARNAYTAGMKKILYYHFGTPQTIARGKTPAEDAIAEAKDFCAALSNVPIPKWLYTTSLSTKRYADIYLDLESDADNITTAQGLEWCTAWIREVESNGHYVGLYSSEHWLEKEVANYQSLFRRNDESIRSFWVPRYGSNSGFPEPQYSPDDKVPDEYGTYDIWQYTSKGNVPGISGDCDLNLATVIWI